VPVDLGLARLSDQLLVATIVCYALAMLGYAAEFAFGSRAGRSTARVGAAAAAATAAADGTAERLPLTVRAPMLVGPAAHPPRSARSR